MMPPINSKYQIIQILINTVLAIASPELMKTIADVLLDVIEDACENSPNKIDDKLVLPLCEQARDIFNIPDNDFYDGLEPPHIQGPEEE